jgi:chaperonin GroES
MSKVAPLADRVVIKPSEETEQMRGGLYIPDTAMDVKVGDKVLYGKYSGTEVTIENEPLLILRESDVLAVIN